MKQNAVITPVAAVSSLLADPSRLSTGKMCCIHLGTDAPRGARHGKIHFLLCHYLTGTRGRHNPRNVAVYAVSLCPMGRNSRFWRYHSCTSIVESTICYCLSAMVGLSVTSSVLLSVHSLAPKIQAISEFKVNVCCAFVKLTPSGRICSKILGSMSPPSSALTHGASHGSSPSA